MVSFAVLFALLQSIGFKVQDLTERRIQENGVSPFGTFYLYRFALIPAVIWCAFFVGYEDILNLLEKPIIIGYIVFIAVMWNVQSFIWSYLANTMSSVSALTTLQLLLYLPMLLVVGTLLNKDIPNIYSLISIGLLLLAFVLQPTQHERNVRSRFSLPVIVIVILVLIRTAVDALNTGVVREALGQITPPVFLGLFSVLTMLISIFWTRLKPLKSQDKVSLKKYWWFAVLFPLSWFLASIPESYSYANLPIYTVVAIGSVTFLLDTASDFYNYRTRLTIRTVVFILLTLMGMGFSVYSVS